MARTNNIQLFKTYIDQLDDVYKFEAKTAVLESNAALVKKGASASEFIVPKIDMDWAIIRAATATKPVKSI